MTLRHPPSPLPPSRFPPPLSLASPPSPSPMSRNDPLDTSLEYLRYTPRSHLPLSLLPPPLPWPGAGSPHSPPESRDVRARENLADCAAFVL